MRLGMGLGLGNLLSGQPLTGFPNDFSFNFDGSNDYLEVQDTLESIFQASYSISFWLKADDGQPSSNQSLFGYRTSANGSINNTVQGKLLTNGKLFFRYEDGTNNSDAQTNSAVFSDGATDWTHIAIVVSESADQIYIYVNGSAQTLDGTLDGDTSSLTFSNFGAGNNFPIGGRNNLGTVGEFFGGKIDEVAIWNTALSASDVAKIGSKVVDLTKYSASNLKLWLRAGDKVLPESDASIARSDFYTDFDGTDDYIAGVGQSFTGAFSIGMCLKPNNVTDSGIGVLGTTTGDSNYIRQFSQGVNIRIAGSGSTYGTGNVLVAGEWIYLAITRDGSNVLKWFVNGAYIGSSATQSGTFTFDNFARSVSTYFNGSISNVSLYQTALDAQTIKQFSKSRFTPMRDNRFSVVDFDGSDDKITFTRQTFTGAFSIIFWFNGDVNTDYQRVFDDSQDGGVSNDIIVKDSNGAITIRINGNYKAQISSVPNNEWSHLAYTRDGSGNIKSYLNGVASGTASSTDSFSLDAIGDGCVMSMASASMYNVEKSAEEVYAIYQQGITYDESSLSGLQAYYRMGDDTSKAYPTIADSSSNSNDGTITNGASDDIQQQAVAMYDMGAFESTGEELGGEKVDNNTSSAYGGGSESNIANVTNGVAITYAGTGTGLNATFSDASLLNTDIVASENKLHKLTFNAYYQGGSAGSKIRIYDQAVNHVTPSLTTTSASYSLYFRGRHASMIFQQVDMGSGNVVYITDMSFKEVLQSADLSDTFPALIDVNEPVLGAELVTSITNSSSNPWETFSGASGNTLALAINSDGTSGEMYSPEFGMSGGEIIKVTITITINSGAILLRFSGTDGTHTSGDLNETINSSGTHTFYAIISGSNRDSLWIKATGADNISNITLSGKQVFGNVGTMTNQDSADLVYSSVLPDQSFLATGVNSAYNFIDLDGSNEKINTDLNSTPADATYIWWMKTSKTTENPVFGHGSSAKTGFTLNWSSTNKPLFYLNASNFRYFSLNDAQDDGNWHCWAIVNDNDDITNAKLYIDGIEQSATSTTSTGANPSHSTGLSIGYGSNYFQGSIGQFAVWNNLLDESTIQAIYNLGRNINLLDIYSNNLVGYWAMSALDASTGLSDVGNGTIYDRSGNSNHGTTTNTESADLASSPNAEPNGYAKGDTNRSTTIP